MKALYAMLLLSLACLAQCHITDKTSSIYKIVEVLTAGLPEMKKKVELNPYSQSPKIQPILKGFKKLKPSIDVISFNGVPLATLDKFLKKLASRVNVPPQYQNTFYERLGFIEFSEFNELMLNDFVFSIGRGGQCKYVLIFVQKSADGLTDWLVGDVKAKFELEPDIYVFQQIKRVFGREKTKTVTKQVPKVLTPEIMEALTDFLQINVIENFANALKIGQ